MSFGGFATPFVQGSLSKKDLGRRVMVVAELLVGFSLGTGLLGLALAGIERLLRQFSGETLWALLPLGLLAGGDLWAIAKHRLYPLGAHRQARKSLLYGGHREATVGIVWGFDAGIGVSTYRVTSGLWVGASLILLGLAKPWTVLFYAGGFCAGLLGMALWPTRRSGREDAAVQRVMWFAARRRPAQILYVLLLFVGGATVAAG